MSSLNSVFMLMFAALALFVGGVLFLVCLRALFAWMETRGWILLSGNRPTYGTLGTALQELRAIAEPRVEYVLEQRRTLQDKRENADIGGPDDPGQDGK